MFLHRNLIKAVLIYVGFFVVVSIIFSSTYYLVAVKNGDTSPFYKWIYFSMMTFATIDYPEVKIHPETWNIIAFQYLVNSVFVPIISGVIFYYILNRPPKIVLPRKLIMRARTSEGSQGTLTLSTKVANRDKHKMYKVSCHLVYSYYKTDYHTYNRETNFTNSIPYIDKTYRFSFELEKFPSNFLRTYLSKNSVNYRNDRILIVVSGKFGSFGDAFLVEKEYGFEDIEIAKDTERLYGYKQKEDGTLESIKINYSNLDKIIPYSEDERAKINETVRQLIEQKEKENKGESGSKGESGLHLECRIKNSIGRKTEGKQRKTSHIS